MNSHSKHGASKQGALLLESVGARLGWTGWRRGKSQTHTYEHTYSYTHMSQTSYSCSQPSISADQEEESGLSLIGELWSGGAQVPWADKLPRPN